MLVSSLSKISARASSSLSRPFSTIPVTNVASVLKLNVRDEPTAVKFDGAMKAMTEKVSGGYVVEVGSGRITPENVSDEFQLP